MDASQQLRGKRRVLYDTVVLMSNTMEEWKRRLLEGALILENMARWATMAKKEECCVKLGRNKRDMEVLVAKLKDYSDRLASLAQLAQNDGSERPFLTWEYSQYADTAETIYTVFHQETQVRENFVESVHQDPNNNVSFWILCWMNLTYFMEDHKSSIQAMKTECGGIQVRGVHKYMRQMILALQSRRKRELFMNPGKLPTPRSAFTDWNYNAELYAFGKRLDEEIEDSLFRQALTERSYVAKERLRQEEVGLNLETMELPDNEYMATEGRTVLQTTVKSTLRYELPLLPQEGVDAICDFLLSEAVLSHISSHIGTKDLILCGEHTPSESTFARVFQAIISAIEKSSGQNRVKLFIQDFVVTHLCDKDINEIWDIPMPWKMLTNIMTERGETFEPRLIRDSGRNTLLSVFVVGIYTSEKKLIGTGIGETVEIAQEMAARDTLKGIFGTREPLPFKFLSERGNNQAVPQVTARAKQKQTV